MNCRTGNQSMSKPNTLVQNLVTFNNQSQFNSTAKAEASTKSGSNFSLLWLGNCKNTYNYFDKCMNVTIYTNMWNSFDKYVKQL